MSQIEYTGRDNLAAMQEAKNYNRSILDLILESASKNSILVDFGAGNGDFAIAAKELGYKVICVEVDSVLSSNLTAKGLTVVDDLDSIEDGSVDFIYSINVLEHIVNDEAIAKVWFDKLRPGGRLLVYVPAFKALYTSMDHKVGHVRRYTKTSLTSKLEKPGFVVEVCRYSDSLGVIATLLYKIFDNGKGDINVNMLKFYGQWVYPINKVTDLVFRTLAGKNVYAIARKNVS